MIGFGHATYTIKKGNTLEAEVIAYRPYAVDISIRIFSAALNSDAQASTTVLLRKGQISCIASIEGLVEDQDLVLTASDADVDRLRRIATVVVVD